MSNVQDNKFNRAIFYAPNFFLHFFFLNQPIFKYKIISLTGKSLSEALIIASTNPQYDDRLIIVHENCKLRIPAEHKLLFSFCFDIQNNFGTQNVLQMLQASEKDLPVTHFSNGNFTVCTTLPTPRPKLF